MVTKSQLATGIGAAEGMSAAGRDGEFEAYMAARQAGLLRTAYLLTGDGRAAERLVQSTLARLYLSWDRVTRREPADGYVRRVMVRENASPWRRARRGTGAGAGHAPRPRPGTDLPEPGERDEALWQVVRALPHHQRAVAVLLYYENLGEAEVAEILDISVERVRSRSGRVLASLRNGARTRPMVSADGEER